MGKQGGGSRVRVVRRVKEIRDKMRWDYKFHGGVE